MGGKMLLVRRNILHFSKRFYIFPHPFHTGYRPAPQGDNSYHQPTPDRHRRGAKGRRIGC